MNIRLRLVFILFFGFSSNSYCMLAKICQLYQWGKNVLSGQADVLLNKFQYDSFNFHRIAGDVCKQDMSNIDGINIELFNGNIVAFNDGKKTPLVLGSIPNKQAHITALKQFAHNLTNNDGIEIFSLNVKAERDALGLSQLIRSNQNVTLFKYPTIDLTAPSIVDLIRAIRDLENRDFRQKGLVLVHCRAGAGRSPLTIAAYLLYVAHKAQIAVTPNQILRYLWALRPQVNLNIQQKEALYAFNNSLNSTGSFLHLYNMYGSLIKQRDNEVAIL